MDLVFGLKRNQFTNANTQDSIDRISESAQGEKKKEQARMTAPGLIGGDGISRQRSAFRRHWDLGNDATSLQRKA
jgi:hypothetical protein